MSKSKFFFFEKEHIHRLNQIQPQKTYQIKISNEIFSFSKAQLIFLSLKAFSYFSKNENPFEILLPESDFYHQVHIQDLVKYFRTLESLFHSTTEFEINANNVQYFTILAKLLDNNRLLKSCSEVSSEESQQFSFNSKMFQCNPENF
jgi:hypothetical protein